MTKNIIDNKPNAVIYLRVSSKKQFDEGYSIASQKSSCDNYARLKKFNVSKVFTDEGVSATIFLWNRPKGGAMKEYIEKNNIKHIIAVKMDRLFRNVRDLLETVDELTSKDIGLHLVEFGGQSLDTTSAMGRFFLTVIGAIGELESGQISERTKESVKHMKKNNKRFTGEIYGWDCNDGNLTPNWHEQYVIDYMRDLYYGYGISGYAISKIMNGMDLKGKLRGIWRSTTVIRTINYDFHQNRDQNEFIKPTWWDSASFTDLIPWTTDSCLNLYPSNSKPPNMPSPYPIVFGKVKTLPRSTKNNNATKDHIQNLASELQQDLVDRKKKTGSNGLLNWNDL
jgi:DNA invertase Pin-like site-specific DNA recombinase